MDLRIKLLTYYLYHLTNITPKHKLELFDKLVAPILNYGSQVWGFCEAKQIERTHLMFCKQLLSVKNSTQNDFIYGELGRTSFYVHRIYAITKYWFKILQSDDRKHIKSIYNLMLRDIETKPNSKNWASLLRNILSNLGFLHVWLSQGVGDIKQFLVVLKQRLTDHFLQQWQSRLNDSSRAVFYNTFSNFCFQPYLDIVLTKRSRVAMTRLRVSSHRLNIEAGRWSRPQITPREERK